MNKGDNNKEEWTCTHTRQSSLGLSGSSALKRRRQSLHPRDSGDGEPWRWTGAREAHPVAGVSSQSLGPRNCPEAKILQVLDTVAEGLLRPCVRERFVGLPKHGNLSQVRFPLVLTLREISKRKCSDSFLGDILQNRHPRFTPRVGGGGGEAKCQIPRR